MKQITIVTAFYNINRENWNVEKRTDDKYFNDFAHWARLQNSLIVYVENEEHKKKVEQIRANFGLADKTKVVVTGPVEDIDRELYERMKARCENDYQVNFHISDKNPEAWSVHYNYIMLLKYWFVKDAVFRNLVNDGMVTWLDFGFGHGMSTYKYAEEFAFEWKYEFPQKVNMFYIKKPDNKPVFDIVRTGEVYFAGFMVMAPKEYWNDFWLLMRKCMFDLTAVGLMDDDQTLLYMAYQEQPELFHIEQTGWFTALKEHGGEHLTLVESKVKESYPLLKKMVGALRRRKKAREYAKKTFVFVNNSDL